mmetsp:Transcript_19480/g.58033  ORF Transcript_19480/g.58033 Transcript_19480/m.58033 type:complete len:397 (+) Transcript_19480:2-1192(+)
MAATAVLACAVNAGVLGHGAVTFPPPRQAIDSNEMPWGGKVPYPVPFEPWCPMPSADARTTDPGRNLTGANGQACFWFSNGCAIGCDACDGNTRGPIPKFRCKAGSGTSANCEVEPIPGATIPMGPKAPVCSNPLNATVCDPKQRTVNTGAECGSADDYFFYSPWRRPGSAPVIDACGTAGGRIPGQGDGGFGAQYTNTTHAKVGDLGSKLPHMPSGVEWKAGAVVEVAWTLQANHGGGYSYRLCPVGENLTEACFQKTPLDFVGKSSLRWGGSGGEQLFFDAVIVSEGTSPAGSMWAKNPVPRAWRDHAGNWGQGSNQFQTGEGFDPVCVDNGIDKQGNGRSCTSEWGPYNMEIVDQVQIPSDLKPGAYVLGWRWDCEESNQIWQSCSDVTVVVA